MTGVCKNNKKADATYVVMRQAVIKHFISLEAIDHHNHLYRTGYFFEHINSYLSFITLYRDQISYSVWRILRKEWMIIFVDRAVLDRSWGTFISYTNWFYRILVNSMYTGTIYCFATIRSIDDGSWYE